MDKFNEYINSKQYIVEVPTGEIIWVTKYEMRVLSDYSMIRYESIKNYWWFYRNKRSEIEKLLKYERSSVT